MFKEGKDIATIAQLRGLSKSTIEGHLSKFVGEGEIGVEELVSRHKVERILEAITETGLINAGPLREKLGQSYTFGEIKAVVHHHQRIKQLNI